jgi:hypothetical protein
MQNDIGQKINSEIAARVGAMFLEQVALQVQLRELSEEVARMKAAQPQDVDAPS